MKLYNAEWRTRNRVAIELEAIRMGGHWKNKKGEKCGAGLLTHYKALQQAIAPWKKWDRWSELILTKFLSNRMVILTGPASSTKTHNMAFIGLCQYLLNPIGQCVLISSTDSRSLELRIWGEIKKLWSAARQVYDDCPGRIVESRQMIVTDVDEDEATDYRSGILAIPCMVGGSFVGLGKFVGIKNGNVLLLADELSFMAPSFYDAIANLRKNPGFRCMGSGNPKDRTDVLGKLAEPSSEIGGWEGYEPTGKTFCYPTRFEDGLAVCLDGRDTPNNDVEPGKPAPFPYIIKREDVARDVEYYGEDSIQVSMFDYGIFPVDAQSKRVITRSLCERFRAFEEPVWTHESVQKAFAIDAAYGSVGGDRCVGIEMHWGKCSDGLERLAFVGAPMVIPVSAKSSELPEDQIANWVKDYCEAPSRNIPQANVGLDSTGRGSLVSAFARIGYTQIIAVEFGGSASDRMVSSKLQVLCRNYYANFMSELWYRFRDLIESDQCRKLPTNVMEEMCMRGWEHVAGNKIKVEPKDKCKLRMGRSPDLGDSAVVGVEIAMRRGFTLLGGGKAGSKAPPNWIKDLLAKQKNLHRTKQLTYA